jgi:hypothetical protein
MQNGTDIAAIIHLFPSASVVVQRGIYFLTMAFLFAKLVEISTQSILPHLPITIPARHQQDNHDQPTLS